MSRTWWAIEVELVSGRGHNLWPRPGRVLIVQPGWTFRMLAHAINQAFARWDLSHLHEFVLADGTLLGPTGPELDTWGQVDDSEVSMTRLSLGEAFAFTFDLSDQWEHVCRVATATVDPIDVAGIVPDFPVAIGGWGALPDQYGRVWRDDDGSGNVPSAPADLLDELPALMPHWGPQDSQRSGPAGMVPWLSDGVGEGDWTADGLTGLRIAVRGQDLDGVAALFEHFDPLHVAHQAASALLAMARGGQSINVIGSVTMRLADRMWQGDAELREELRAALLPQEETGRRPIPVDLDMVAMTLEHRGMEGVRQWLDLQTGEWIMEESRGVAMPDGVQDSDRYAAIASDERNEGVQDMLAFIEELPDVALAEQLLEAVRGKGAFRRFGNRLNRHERYWSAWRTFSNERQLGRAREWLAAHGVRPAD